MPTTRGAEDFWDSLERRDGFLRSRALPVFFGMLGWNAVVKEKWGKCLDVPKISQVGILAGEWDLATPLFWRAGKFPMPTGDPDVQIPVLGTTPSWSKFPSPGFSWGKFLPSTGDPSVHFPAIVTIPAWSKFPFPILFGENSFPISSLTTGDPNGQLRAVHNNSRLE